MGPIRPGPEGSAMDKIAPECDSNICDIEKSRKMNLNNK